ncbi:MAG: hypothetical protein ATN35_09965 [Epulopiscium sp. Nele67-Bin004]|nr:MAG: hypothetical protein ATN35_09965 [Epulopiscium sp. Nele67-Bin004]
MNQNTSAASVALIFQRFSRDATQNGTIKAGLHTHGQTYTSPSLFCEYETVSNRQNNRDTDKLTEGDEIKCKLTNLLDVLTAKHLGDQSTNFALYAYL